jgi:hypothetical protein
MENWLLISNCNTFGLASSLNILSNRYKLDFIDVWHFRKFVDKYRQTIPRYDRVIINPEAEHSDFDFNAIDTVSRIPTLDFDAYHPDLCYLSARGERLHGPTGAYHSMLVFASFELGLTPKETRKMFRRDVFDRAGFFTRWPAARDRLISTFAAHGLDISGPFRIWSRGDCFMHALGHPKARPIHDIARAFLEKCGVEAHDAGIVPHDTLVDGVCMPVYPEVGEAYGVKGSYGFKVHGEYRLLSLETFIENSFAFYSEFGSHEIKPDLGFSERYGRVKHTIAEAREW